MCLPSFVKIVANGDSTILPFALLILNFLCGTAVLGCDFVGAWHAVPASPWVIVGAVREPPKVAQASSL
jgi:hypothetical protein